LAEPGLPPGTGKPVELTSLSQSEARRIALAAQGFDRARSRRPVTRRHVAAVIRRLGLIQLDFVNVLVPSHYLVPFSRLGPYDRALLDDLTYRRRECTEQWAHEASIIPMETWPLLRHRMARYRVRPWGFEKFLDQHADYVRWVLDEVRTRGPLAADSLKQPDGRPRRISAYVPKRDAMAGWLGTVPRVVLETLFGRGTLAVTERGSSLARMYDLAERVIPREHSGREVGREEAERALLVQAARAHGVGTAQDLADYYRMSARDARPRLAELVESGELREVRVERWRELALLHAEAKVPRTVEARALLSPFDPVVWFRPRTARLFGFHYRLEIFVPAEKRLWGYYVLPFLLGDRMAGRVDLKADRQDRRLLVLAAYAERGCDKAEVAEALAAEVRTMATWLGLDEVLVGRKGDLAKALAAAIAG